MQGKVCHNKDKVPGHSEKNNFFKARKLNVATKLELWGVRP